MLRDSGSVDLSRLSDLHGPSLRLLLVVLLLQGPTVLKEGCIPFWVAWWSFTGSCSTLLEQESPFHSTQSDSSLPALAPLFSSSGSVAVYLKVQHERTVEQHFPAFNVWAVKLLLYLLYHMYICLSVQEETVYIEVKVCVLFPAVVCIHGETSVMSFINKWRPLYKINQSLLCLGGIIQNCVSWAAHYCWPGEVAHIYNPGTRKVEAREKQILLSRITQDKDV